MSKKTKTPSTTTAATPTVHAPKADTGKAICGRKGGALSSNDPTCGACLKILAHAAAKAKDATAAKPAPTPEQADAVLAGMAAKIAAGAKTKKPAKAPRAPKPAAPRARDPRLPAEGTVLSKTNRAGKKVQCTVTALGACYKGSEFKSLSAAAVAAAKDLGISCSQNGYIFWGLVKPRPAIKDPVEALNKAWSRYEATLQAVRTSGTTLEKNVAAKLDDLLKAQAMILMNA